MIGHKQIVELRKHGKKPSMVMVDFAIAPVKPRYDFQHPENQLSFGCFPTVYIAADETPDLRFLVGMNVHVTGREWSDAYIEFLDRVTKYKPEQVFANAYAEDSTLMLWKNNEWSVTKCQS